LTIKSGLALQFTTFGPLYISISVTELIIAFKVMCTFSFLFQTLHFMFLLRVAHGGGDDDDASFGETHEILVHELITASSMSL
jgi:hypothetical protein